MPTDLPADVSLGNRRSKVSRGHIGGASYARRFLLPALIGGLISCGSNATQPAGPAPMKPAVVDGSRPDDHPGDMDAAVGSDACAARLHDLEYDLLLYYSANTALPGALTDLVTTADPGQSPNYLCPFSNTPFGYARLGLRSPQHSKVVVVYQPQPTPDHLRRCIQMFDPQSGHPDSMEVVVLPEAIFQTYR